MACVPDILIAHVLHTDESVCLVKNRDQAYIAMSNAKLQEKRVVSLSI